MKTLNIIVLSLLFAVFSSCTEGGENGNGNGEQLGENDYLIFGQFNGGCLGDNCNITFKLTQNKLYEDASDQYPNNEPLNGEFDELGDEYFKKVNDLTNSFPSELLNEKKLVLGCPDCADQGGYYIEYKKNGEVRQWRIDSFKDQVPEYLHGFMNEIDQKIGIIKKMEGGM